MAGGNPVSFVEYDGHRPLTDGSGTGGHAPLHSWDPTGSPMPPSGNRLDAPSPHIAIYRDGEQVYYKETWANGADILPSVGESLAHACWDPLPGCGIVDGIVEGSISKILWGIADVIPVPVSKLRYADDVVGAFRHSDEAVDAVRGADDAAELAAKACSFIGGTAVLMADGTKKPIKDVAVGDKVMATDPETGEQVAKTVEHVFVHEDTVIDLIVDGEIISTTEDHPFWSVTDQKFVRADDLAGGEQVLAAEGRLITVTGLERGSARKAVAYNLSVKGIHTFHVGTSEILVHNSCFSALDALNNPKSLETLTPSQIDDLARNAGFEALPGRAGGANPATRYYLPGTNRSQGFRVLPRGVAGQTGVKSGPYLKYFGGPLHGTYVPLGAP